MKSILSMKQVSANLRQSIYQLEKDSFDNEKFERMNHRMMSVCTSAQQLEGSGGMSSDFTL